MALSRRQAAVFRPIRLNVLALIHARNTTALRATYNASHTQKTTRGAAAPLDSYTTFDFSTCSTNQLTSFMVGLRNTKPSNANGTT